MRQPPMSIVRDKRPEDGKPISAVEGTAGWYEFGITEDGKYYVPIAGSEPRQQGGCLSLLLLPIYLARYYL